ncbi:MAG: hypothetical protein M1831_002281 [Alyxoria varia]|nr:MAG: hypothetical protein M1831_002281 [Alyxoria varia]
MSSRPAAFEKVVEWFLTTVRAAKPNQTSSNSRPGSAANAPGSASTPTNPLAGLQLPQPTTTGNLDLSAVKPVNSGAVNLAEAIAKANSIAKMKQQGSDGSERASLSHTPPRRDNFRDNYNPYRDERREGKGRDRSRSPNRGTPHGHRDRSPNVPSNSDIITVPSSSVGLIIGRNGDNMKRIESESGARVQFINGPEAGQNVRQCRITGNQRQRADAISEIYRTCDETPSHNAKPTNNKAPPTPVNIPAPKGPEENVQMMVPDRTVGLIIGRHGETIRDLQDRSKCHVNIVGENRSVNGQRPVNLIGDSQSIEAATRAINEIVESDTRGPPEPTPRAASYPPPPPQSGYSPYGAYPPPDMGRINDFVNVPSEAVGMIIGKGGETIKDMQSTSGAKINVSPPAGADIERHIEVIGTHAQIDNAKRLIWDKVQTVRINNAKREKQGGFTRGNDYPPPTPSTYGSYPPAPAPAPAPAPYPGHSHPPPHHYAPPPHHENDPYAAYGG